MAAVLVALAAWCAVAHAGGVRPPEVNVSRCCPAGTRLAPDALQAAALTPAAAQAWCQPAEEARAFAPRVYAPALGGFLPRLPAHWRLVEGVLPACPDLRVLPDHTAPYALLANNGSLVLRELRRALPPTRYCADVGVALVCLEDSPPPPAKCCIEGQAFDGARCVEDAERGTVALEELRALANGSALGFGWPTCAGAGAGGPRYAETGALAEAHLEADGALALGGCARRGGRARAGVRGGGARRAPAPLAAPPAVRRRAGGGRRVPGGHARGRVRAAGGAPRAALALPDALRGGADAGRRAAGRHAAGRGRRAADRVPRARRVHALLVPVRVLLAQHYVFQYLVDIPRLPSDVAGARAGGVAAARVHGVRVGGAAGGGGRGGAAGRVAAGRRRRRRALPAPALRRAALLVLRRHGDPRLLLRARGRAAARQPGALRVHHAPAHLRPLASRRGQVYFRTGGAGARVRQAGGGDGRDVGRGRGVVGGGRARVRVVRDRPAERAAGGVHLPGGGMPAARVGRAQAGRGGVLRARGGAPPHALVDAPAVVRRVAHAHHGGARAPHHRRPHPHGDRLLNYALGYDIIFILQYYFCIFVNDYDRCDRMSAA